MTNLYQGGFLMQFYTKTHQYHCGIDLHTNKMFICILDNGEDILLHRNIKAEPGTFLKVIEPFRNDIVVCAECMFSWYWLRAITIIHGQASKINKGVARR